MVDTGNVTMKRGKISHGFEPASRRSWEHNLWQPRIAVYGGVALFRFYFSKNLVAYVTARMYVSHRTAPCGPPSSDLPSSPFSRYAFFLS